MKKILLVDDSYEIQEIISQYFSIRSDYIIVTAEDGEIAMDQIKIDVPDLIILDIIMPKVNGLAFLHNLRETDTFKDIPVILMSGTMIDEEIRNEAFSLGVVDFIEKPLDLGYLYEKANSILIPEKS